MKAIHVYPTLFKSKCMQKRRLLVKFTPSDVHNLFWNSFSIWLPNPWTILVNNFSGEHACFQIVNFIYQGYVSRCSVNTY